MTFTDYRSQVELLISKLRKTLDEAILIAEVPPHYIERLRQSFDPKFVKIKLPSMIVDSSSSYPRLKIRPASEPHPYFTSYAQHLQNVRSWDSNVVENLGAASKRIAERMPDPERIREFRAQGLVVGYVQSGKTANMAALISRAADHGYKFFIILAGLYKDLRSQTQDRMDQDITGRSEEIEADLLVKLDPLCAEWIRYTASGLEGDFRRGTTQFDPSESTPKIAILKKHPAVLDAFRNWIQSSRIDLRNFPALLIDDEADQASINTRYGRIDDEGNPIDPSKTNLRIRELVSALPAVAYVGYTATPFANVLIDAEEHDLYPRDFIAVLDEPAGYCGARLLFGLGMSPSGLSPEEAGDPELNLLRFISEDELDCLDEIPAGAPVPQVMIDAIIAFILSSAARLSRGQNDHFSMLIHPSHEKHVHESYRSAISQEFNIIATALNHPAKFKGIIDHIREIWERDFIETSVQAGIERDSIPAFDDVIKIARGLIPEIQILVLNSGSDDVTDYRNAPHKRYIIIGGNRLSRGLTLEGLAVSLFLRNSDKYDTLLQMGRWFGYRSGYFDLTRIYVSEELAESFAALARVELELREDLKQYSKEPNPPTPLEIMPKVRSHPTLSVTSPLKMGAGRTVNISLQHSRVETVSFPLDRLSELQENKQIAGAWLKELGNPVKGSNSDAGFFWTDLDSEPILKLIRAYNFSVEARKTNRQVLFDYIQRQNENGELVKWDVIVPRGNQSSPLYTWAPGIATHTINRARLNGRSKKSKSIRVLSSPSDIDSWKNKFGRDPKDSKRGALFLYIIDKNSEGRGGENRLFEDSSKAIDVVGLVFNFPESRSNATVEYVTQGDF